MATAPNEKHHLHLGMILFTIVLFLYLGAQIAYIYTPELTFLEGCRIVGDNIFEHPEYAFHTQGMWPMPSWVIMFFGFLIVLAFYSRWLRDRNRHEGKEKGSAKWNTFRRFLREYAYGTRAICLDKAQGKTRSMKNPLFQHLAQTFWYLVFYIKTIPGRIKNAWKEVPLGVKVILPVSVPVTLAKYLQSKGPSDPPANGKEPGNLIFSKKIRFNLNKMSNLNNNVVIVGGPGTGKTRGYVKPNLLQFNTSYVVTDPSGELMGDIGGALMAEGYRVKCFNLDEMQYSCGYNPFDYIRSDEHVMVLVDCIIKNTDTPEAQKGDQFFAKAEQALLMAIFYYLYYFGSPEEKNMRQVMRLLGEAEVDEKNPNYKSKLDLRFDEIKNGTGRCMGNPNPDHVAVRSYNIFKQGTGKTAKSILISAEVRLAPFNIEAIENLTMVDTIHLEEIGDMKQALFIITPTETQTFSFLASMMYTQLFEILYHTAKSLNINTHQLVYGNMCALRSRPFENKKTEEETLSELKALRQKYLDAKLESVEEGNEDEKITTYKLVTAEGETLRDFQGKKEADLFIDCLKNGTYRHGDRFTTIPVHCILDEFKNIGKIPAFDQYLSTMRKFHISCTIILQSIDQLKAMYDKDWGTIMGDCSTQIFLGSTNQEDLEYFSKALGSATQTIQNSSGGGGKTLTGSNYSYNQEEYQLMRPEQLRVMPTSDSVVLISGQDPFYDKKFKLETHKNYKMLKKVFNHRLYFHCEDYRNDTAFMPQDMKLDCEHREEYVQAENDNPFIQTYEKQRNRHPSVAPKTKTSAPMLDVLAEAAEEKGMKQAADEINCGILTMPNLTPLYRNPYPPAQFKPEVTPQQISELVITGPDGYPI